MNKVIEDSILNKTIEDELIERVGPDAVRIQEPMKLHTTFRIGGKAHYFVTPQTVEQIREVLLLCNRLELPYYILGNGSNLLVSDAGYDGVIIQLYKNFNKIHAQEKMICAQSGALLSTVAAEAWNHSLTGFEFAGGIPGTIGGAVTMNAGAYGGEMKQIVKEVLVLDTDGNIFLLSAQELELEYRKSILQKKNYIALEVTVELEKGSPQAIHARMEELKTLRKSKQPLEMPSAGSTFKRPEGNFAGKLIMEAGLKGARVGHAQVSDKHCGFVVNNGDATAADVLGLIEHIKSEVYLKSGIILEPEVKRLGKF